MTDSEPMDQALVACFRLQIDAHERLRHDHARLGHDHTRLVQLAAEREAALAEAISSERRSAELAQAMSGTIDRYVATCALRTAIDDAGSSGPLVSDAATSTTSASNRRALHDLEMRLQMKEAELSASRAQLTERARCLGLASAACFDALLWPLVCPRTQ